MITVTAWLAIGLAGIAASGCGSILGPACLARQKTGTVATLSGRVEPGQIVTQLVPYELQGSQNDVRISWDGQGTVGGPRVRIYATSTACTSFTPPPSDNPSVPRGDCTTFGNGGGYPSPEARPCVVAGTCTPTADEIIWNSLLITGPGNGAPAGFSEYKLHVVGDASRAAAYSITITWFFGPDC
jgi:hypothetical protein